MKEVNTFVLSMVNDWLKFAEGKSSILIGFNAAVLFGIITLLLEISDLNCIIAYYLYCAIIMLFISMIITFFSLLPKLSIKNNKISNNNLIYFGDIAKMKLENIKIGLNEENIDDYLVQQIHINSKISLRKYKLFYISMWFTIVAFLNLLTVIPLGVLIIRSIKNGKQ